MTTCPYCSGTGRTFSSCIFPTGGSLDYDPETKTIICLCIRNRKPEAKLLTKVDCPTCNGTTRRSVLNFTGSPTFWAFDPSTNTCICDNCGFQKPFGMPTGKTHLRSDGTPCVHDYWLDRGQRKCQFCPDSYIEG